MRAVGCLLLSPIPPLLLLAALLPRPAATRFTGGSNAIVVTLVAAQRVAAPPSVPPVAPPSAPVPSTGVSGDAGADGAGWNEGAAYLPAAQLTERPHVLRDIVPEWTQQAIPQQIECLLLISEYGDVDRVLFDDTVLSPAQQQALRERLLAVRFAPGRLYGRPVKTALRIEVRLH